MSTETLAPATSPFPPLTFTLDKPIEQLSWIQQSLLFAELARLSYADAATVVPIANAAGIEQCDFIEKEGAEAYVFGNRFDCMIVCRGTEPNQWNDIKADANAWTIAYEIGRVHSGFHSEVDALWPMLEKHIAENQRPMWFAGHSLGAAMATVCAVRCKLSPIPSNPNALFTFGSPRAGDKAFAAFLKVNHFRWVNNNDIVARIPPRWLGYRHMGQEIYLNRNGRISNLRNWLRVHDRLRGLLASLMVWRLDYLSDHSMVEYIQHIGRYVREEAQGTPVKRPKHLMDD